MALFHASIVDPGEPVPLCLIIHEPRRHLRASCQSRGRLLTWDQERDHQGDRPADHESRYEVTPEVTALARCEPRHEERNNDPDGY